MVEPSDDDVDDKEDEYDDDDDGDDGDVGDDEEYEENNDILYKKKKKLFFGLFNPKKKKIRSVGKMFLAIGWDIEFDTSISTIDHIFINILVFFLVYTLMDLFIFKIKYH